MCGEVEMKNWDRHDGRLCDIYACLYSIIFSDVVYVCDMFIDNGLRIYFNQV